MFKVYGMNSIAAYMMPKFIKMNAISTALLYGTAQYLGEEWYGLLIAVANVVLSYLLLYYMYRRKYFLKA